MERRRIVQLVLVLVIVAVGVTFLLYNVVREPSYDEMLARVESLMVAHPEVSLSYRVEYQSLIDGADEFIDGAAYFSRNGSDVSWNNSLALLEGTFYDLRPHELVEVMKLSIVDNVETYLADIPCHMLNGFIAYDQESIANFVVDDFNYVRIMACFDKETGYPLQYTFLSVGGTDGILISYNNISHIPSSPPEFNESQVAEANDALVELIKDVQLS